MKNYVRENEYLKEILDCVTDGIMVFDTKGIIYFVNTSLLETLGYEKRDEIINQNIQELLGNNNLYNSYIQIYLNKIQKVCDQKIEILTKSGTALTLLIDLQLISSQELIVATVHRIYKIESKQKVPIIQIKQIQDILETSADGIIIIDEEQIIHSFNPAAESIFGYNISEVLGKSLSILIPKKHIPAHGKLVKDFLKKKKPQIMGIGREITGICKDGRQKDLEVGISKAEFYDEIFMIAAIRDVTERKQIERNLWYLANYDSLTDFYSRRYFHETLEKVIANAAKDKQKIALFFVDLDKFKMVNDNFGHKTGNILLQRVSKRLKNSVRKGDMIGRLGGDEFGIILGDNITKNKCEQIAQRIVNHLSQSFKIEQHEIYIGASIGIAIFPEDGNDVDSIIKKADVAMYYVKKRGKNAYCFIQEIKEKE